MYLGVCVLIPKAHCYKLLTYKYLLQSMVWLAIQLICEAKMVILSCYADIHSPIDVCSDCIHSTGLSTAHNH